MKRAIELEFGPSLFESPRELLFKLQQHDTVFEYYSEFVALANRTNIEPQDALRDCFISGLHLEIKREVKVQCPPSLMRVVSLARLYEDTLAPSMKTTNVLSPYKSIAHTQTSYPPTKPLPPKLSLPALLPNPNQPPQNINTKPPIKRLTMAEQQLRREKGLCFWCDEKFTPNHRCPNKHFMLYQLEPPEEDEANPEENVLPQLEHQVLQHHLSYNTMHGTSGPTTIRVKAQINGLDIQALIDGESSDSFIQPRIAKFLNLPVQPAPGFKVMVGNFDIMAVEGCIPSLEISLQGYKV